MYKKFKKRNKSNNFKPLESFTIHEFLAQVCETSVRMNILH